jgi:hypothetical protein
MVISEWISGLFKPASDAYVAKAQATAIENQAKIAAETTKVQLDKDVEIENLKADEAWEDGAQKNSGWKDELWTLGFFAVFIGSFLPFIQSYVAVGIAQLSTYPAWFMLLFSSAVMASFGIRFWRRR